MRLDLWGGAGEDAKRWLSSRDNGLNRQYAAQTDRYLWFKLYDGSALQTQSAKVPVAIMTGEDTYGTGNTPQVGLVTFRDVITNGGGICVYDQRVGGSPTR